MQYTLFLYLYDSPCESSIFRTSAESLLLTSSPYNTGYTLSNSRTVQDLANKTAGSINGMLDLVGNLLTDNAG